MGGARDVSAQNRPVEIIRKTAESRFVLAHVPHKRRAPGSDRYRIDESQRRDIAAVEQMSPKRGSASEIVRDDVRPRDAPVIEQRGEYPVLHAERYVLLRPHFRAAIAEQIVVKDLAVPCNVRRDASPDQRGARAAG